MTYNRMFTLHGVVMIFLFMIPAIPAAFGNFILPLMLGAKDVAFPQAQPALALPLLTGAHRALGDDPRRRRHRLDLLHARTAPPRPTTVVPILLGVFILGFSSILTGLNFIVTIHTLRAPGLTWMRMPLFVWAIYATSIIQVLATPVLGLCCCWSASSTSSDFGIFDPGARAATRCSSSTCSGSTRTPPSTSWCCRPWA